MERGGYRASRYDPGRDREHHLSILIGQDLIAWVAHDITTAEPHALGWGTEMGLLHRPDLPQHPRSVSYVSLPEWSTLVPEGALGPRSAQKHLSLVHGKLPEGTVRDEPVRDLGASCIYIHDEVRERSLLDRFPNARPLPLQAVLVQGALLRALQGPVVLAHRGADRLDIAVAADRRILMSNTFPVHSAEDLLYFCLLAMDRCGLSAEATPLRTGGTHLQSAERGLLDRYFADHASAVPFTWPGGSTDGPADRWLAAMDQFACVS